MSCSIKKLKSHMLLTCKSFMFSDFTWKKIFYVGRLVPPPPCPTFLYGPDRLCLFYSKCHYLIFPLNMFVFRDVFIRFFGVTAFFNNFLCSSFDSLCKLDVLSAVLNAIFDCFIAFRSFRILFYCPFPVFLNFIVLTSW